MMSLRVNNNDEGKAKLPNDVSIRAKTTNSYRDEATCIFPR